MSSDKILTFSFYYAQCLMMVAFVANPAAAAESKPLVINTWNFVGATEAGWTRLNENEATAADAIEAGCSWCEANQCDGTVGFGGSPDENGETTLDAMVMDGKTLNVGAVANLRRVKDAASVARRVMENTHHSLLAGELATQFAVEMGFVEESLNTDGSSEKHNEWVKNSCQPNFWTNVQPDPSTSCGPYSPLPNPIREITTETFGDAQNHDTIGMVAIDKSGWIVAGTSTNGANHKIPGRVGDSPIPGAGAYADEEAGGAAVATGDGDVMLRLLPSFVAVEAMRRGLPPTAAAKEAIDRVSARYPNFFGAVLAVSLDNSVYGAACHGMESFPFSVASEETNGRAIIVRVDCSSGEMWSEAP